MFQPAKEWVDKVNLSSFELENFFKFVLARLAREKPNNLTPQPCLQYSHANTPLGQSERAYYLSYFIKWFASVFHPSTRLIYALNYVLILTKSNPYLSFLYSHILKCAENDHPLIEYSHLDRLTYTLHERFIGSSIIATFASSFYR